jgi:hypothetical protein
MPPAYPPRFARIQRVDFQAATVNSRLIAVP